ncbi:MAG: helix-turn-helix transcriptional regulator [Betaproteobacteria bacterium]|nr:helix-turn-helix transcriptional regulator [Betaproteobacteria bacterium]
MERCFLYEEGIRAASGGDEQQGHRRDEQMATKMSKTAAAAACMSIPGDATNPTPIMVDPWSGTVDEKQLKRPGGVLMAALVRCAAERGQSISQLAEALGYSYPYINLLMSGLRRVDQVSDDFAQACAAYLRVPRVAVLMMAGRLKAEDFFEAHVFKAKAVDAAMRFIEDDPQWGSLVTAELRTAKPESRFCLVKLYESATGRKLLDGELDPRKFGEQLQDMKLHTARQRRALEAAKQAA